MATIRHGSLVCDCGNTDDAAHRHAYDCPIASGVARNSSHQQIFEALESWDEKDEVTVNTPHGSVKIAGMGGLVKFCAELIIMRQLKTSDRFRKGVTFAASLPSPFELPEPRHPGPELQRARAEVAALKEENERLARELAGARNELAVADHDHEVLLKAARAEAHCQTCCEDAPCEPCGRAAPEPPKPLDLDALRKHIEQHGATLEGLAGLTRAIYERKEIGVASVDPGLDEHLREHIALAREPEPLKLIELSDEVVNAIRYAQEQAQRQLERASAVPASVLRGHRADMIIIDDPMGAMHESGPGLAARYPDATKGGADNEPSTCDVGADWED